MMLIGSGFVNTDRRDDRMRPVPAKHGNIAAKTSIVAIVKPIHDGTEAFLKVSPVKFAR